MSHLSGRCDCGRVIHFPKGSTFGDTWTCHKCGKTWHIDHHGDPLHSRRSKAPPENGPSTSSDGNGINPIPLVVAGVVAIACAPTLCLVGAGLGLLGGWFLNRDG